MCLPEQTSEEKLSKYQKLNALNREFIATATLYAKIIISEYFIASEKKSLRPKAIGGIAGGVKYLWKGILFKLADGKRQPYNDNFEAAAKVMGHELKGANSYFRCAIPGVHIALQAVIDYRGFRMLAQAYIPIDESTIRIGSSDAGKSMHSHPGYITKLKWTARELNISEHRVQGQTIYSACDVEGHEGRDGRFYLIDLARTVHTTL